MPTDLPDPLPAHLLPPGVRSGFVPGINGLRNFPKLGHALGMQADALAGYRVRRNRAVWLTPKLCAKGVFVDGVKLLFDDRLRLRDKALGKESIARHWGIL